MSQFQASQPNGPVDWWLQGESIVALVGRRGLRSELPGGVSRLPGPMLLTATCFSGSPQGPYLELAIAEPARVGAQVGWCRTFVVVDRADVQRESRVRWGQPSMLGRLEWVAQGTTRRLVWLDQDVTVSGAVHRPAVPWMMLQRSLQHRGGDNVVVPSRLRGLAHVCSVRVDAPDDLPMAEALRGRHAGAVLTGVHSRWQPAVVPATSHLTRRSAIGLTSPTQRGAA